MKIIQLVYSLSSGGAEKFVVDLSNQLANMGNEVIFCMLLSEQNEKYVFNKRFLNQKVRFHSMNFKKGFSLIKSYKLCKFIENEKPDIVHCHLNVIPYIFKLALTNKKIKFFHTLHSITTHTYGSKTQYYINKFFYKKGLITPVTISRLCQKSYEEIYKLNNSVCINNGRSPVIPTASYNKVQDEIKKYKKNDKTIVFCHVARYSPEKNQNLLIDIFNKLNDLEENFILLVIGSGYNSESGEKLKEKACKNIFFIGEKENVGDYLLCSNAFCLTSKFEGSPISLLEALSCGITPISTPVGGVPDVIINNEYGYLSKDLSIESYIDAIRHFIQSPISSQKLKQYFESEFSMKICAERYLKLFQR